MRIHAVEDWEDASGVGYLCPMEVFETHCSGPDGNVLAAPSRLEGLMQALSANDRLASVEGLLPLRIDLLVDTGCGSSVAPDGQDLCGGKWKEQPSRVFALSP